MLRKSTLLRRLVFQTLRWNSSSGSTNTNHGFSVSEIQIPYSNGHYIAGKLWKGVEDPNFSKKIPPIICLHGWLDNCSSFDPLLPLIIKPNMTAVAIDLPGHGFSSHFNNCTHYDPLDGFLSIHRTIRHFGFEKVILLGHSMGSVLCFLCAGTFPELVDGYIALDNVRPIPKDTINFIRSFTEKIFVLEEKLNRRLPPPAYSYDEALERSYLGRDKSICREGCKILLQRGALQRPEDGKYQFTHDLRVTVPTAVGRFTAEQSAIIASDIKCKVCIMKGEPGIDYEPREEFLKVVDSIRRSSDKKVEFHLVPGTHHFHLNSPELIAPIINNFLWL